MSKYTFVSYTKIIVEYYLLQFALVCTVKKNFLKATPIIGVCILLFSVQVLAIQTLATTEERVRSVRPTGVIPSLVMCASVYQVSAEFTANTVSWTSLFPIPYLKCLERLRNLI